MSTSPAAHAVPTTTGTTAAGSVRGRAPSTHRLATAVIRLCLSSSPVAKLIAVDTADGPAFVARLRDAWDAGHAVFPLDHRVPEPTRFRLLDAVHAADDVDAGDALVLATSGTTGDPRGVVLTHEAVGASAAATSNRLGVDRATDRWLACLPLAHVGGLSVVTRALITGTRLVTHTGFDAAAVTAAAHDGATLVALVPTALGRIDPALFRRIVLGGSAPPAALPTNVTTTYGMTETGSGIVYDGLPLDGVDIAIDRDGQILVRGPMLLRCYRDGTDPKDPDGWLATGDAGDWTPDRRLIVRGRMADLIITGGENVWPAAVEAILAEHPAVAEVVVIGRPDAEWGERVVAVVVPARAGDPPTLDELRGFVRERLASWAAPRELELVTSLPRTSIGKVRRSRASGL